MIVVGHTSCGGVGAAVKQALREQQEQVEPPPQNALNRHLTPLTELARYLRVKIKERHSLDDDELYERLVPLLTEASVRRQIQTILEHPVIQDNWKGKVSPLNGKVNPRVTLHGWIHNISTGKLVDLGFDVPPPSDAQS